MQTFKELKLRVGYIIKIHVRPRPANDPFNLLLNYFFLCRNKKIECYDLNGLKKATETHIGGTIQRNVRKFTT